MHFLTGTVSIEMMFYPSIYPILLPYLHVVVNSLLSSDVSWGSVITIKTSSVFRFLKTTFVRYAYVELWKRICKQYEAALQASLSLYVLITGASGTGKSAFITFALAKLLKKHNSFLSSMPIVVSAGGKYIYQYSITGSQGNVKKLSKSALEDMLSQTPIIWFMDGKEHKPFHQELGISKGCLLILTASPHENNYRYFKKLSPFKYRMPWPCCWNCKCYLQDSNDDMVSNVAMWNDKEDYFRNELNLMYHHCYNAALDIKKCNDVLRHVGPLYFLPIQNMK